MLYFIDELKYERIYDTDKRSHSHTRRPLLIDQQVAHFEQQHSTLATMAGETTTPSGHHVILFYKYAEVPSPEAAKAEQDAICRRLGLVGRILISEEGINATLSSASKAVIDEYIAFLCTHETFAMKPEDFKHSFHAAAAAPFVELLIKYVREIVSTGGVVARPNMDASDAERGYLTPQQFHEAMEHAVANKDKTVVLDVRAHKEFLVGHFEDAVDPEVKNFSEYYAFLQNRIDDMKDKKVLMYCTGGIRCEKASNFLRSKGLEDVHHLKGGIHKYLEAYQDGGFFKGKNFVFDKRCVCVSPCPSAGYRTVDSRKCALSVVSLVCSWVRRTAPSWASASSAKCRTTSSAAARCARSAATSCSCATRASLRATAKCTARTTSTSSTAT